LPPRHARWPNEITFSSVFEADFASIVTHFAAGSSPEVALRFENCPIQAVELIAQTPEIGRRRSELEPVNLRRLCVTGFDRYLVFCQGRADAVFFVRLRHGAMDLPAIFF
jgi:plasmid stabilization system protein ParE